MQKLITLTDLQTYYVALDPTAMIGTSKKLGLFPLSFQSTTGLCLAYTYASTLSTTGTELIPQKVNSNTPVTPLCKIYLDCTLTITSPSNPREYGIGSKSTNQSSGGGANMVDVDKQFPVTTPIILKLMNQETSNNIITVGIVWFEY